MNEALCPTCGELDELVDYHGTQMCQLCAEFFEAEVQWRDDAERHIEHDGVDEADDTPT